jgi:prevent-host-death family protein
MTIYGHIVTMKANTVNVALLKSGLCGYLDEVQHGNEIVVVSHKRPVARIVPFRGDNPLKIIRPVRSLAGVARLRGVTPLCSCDPVALLVADRSRR